MRPDDPSLVAPPTRLDTFTADTAHVRLWDANLDTRELARTQLTHGPSA